MKFGLKNMRVRNKKGMGTIFVILFIILTLATTINAQIPEGDIEWVDPQEVTLGFAEHFVRDNFVIEATDFYENSVLITIYENNKLFGLYDSICIPFCTGKVISTTVAKMGDSWNITDSANITRMNILIKDLKEVKGNNSANEGLNVIVDQRVKIQTRLVGSPTPILSILPKERKINNRTFVDRIFIIGSEVSINFSIKNEGKATLRSMHLILNRSEIKELPFLFPEEKIDRELPELKANETTIINVRFRAPFVDKRKNFIISATISGVDAFGRRYNVTDSTYIIVRPYLERIIDVEKYLPEKIYMGDIVYVTLYIRNNGFKDINGVNLFEEIPAGFEPLDEMWNLSNFTLKGNENRIVMYKLKPKRPGIFTFPEKSSIIEWRGGGEMGYGVGYNNKSDIIIVSGPYVELKKSGIVEGNKTKITIFAKNLGDMTAIARLRDMVPKDIPIAQSLVIRPGNSATFSYSFNTSKMTDIIYDGKVTLPGAEAIILDQFMFSNERYKQKAISNDLTLNMTI